MQIKSANVDELAPFRLDVMRPPREVVLTARLLLGTEELVASYVEDHEDQKEAVSNVFAVTRTRLIVVRGTGNPGWDWASPPSDRRDVTNTAVRLSSIHAISAAAVEFGSNDFGEGLWAAQRLAIDLPGRAEALVIPEFGLREDEQREPFQQALMASWSET